ncbi:glycosyltransferase [Candidatus Falkowbacteria bacterium]|nr:glycosyltransferase [Candidatus Falkowbacteria bacterium]
MAKKVAVIMINYKKYADRFLQESYDSLLKLNYPRSDYKIYVVDNLTSLETQAKIKELAPEAELVLSDGNGWGYGNNAGAAQAIKDGFDDYFYFVNMDTVFHPDSLIEAVKAALSDQKIGIVQSKLLLHPPVNGRYMLNSKGNRLTYLGFAYCAGDGKEDDAGEEITDIVSASGAALLITREVFLKIGKCDESYFMYHDDVELSFKAKLLGLRLVLAPKSIVYHKHEFSRSIRQLYSIERNRFKFLFEFYKLPTLLVILPAFLFMELGMMPYEIINGWFLTKLKVYGYFLNPKNLAATLKKRRAVQATRKISDKAMLNGMVGIIDFQQINNPVLKYVANPIFNFYWRAAKKIIIW